MRKFLFYGMTGEKSCFQHVLLNAAQLAEAGHEVRVIFEGASVKLVPLLESENNPVYGKLKDQGLIAGICLACSKVLGVYEACVETGLPMLSDMSGHAGMKPFVEAGYEVISM